MARSFKTLVTSEATTESKGLGDLQFLQGVRKFPQRVKCALLAWRAVEQALSESGDEATVSTEIDS
jgi:nitrogen fixation NifU-like protein